METQNKAKFTNLEAEVQELRDDATKMLRMQKIQAVLNQVFNQEKEITRIQEILEGTNLDLETILYEIDKMDKEHPLYERNLKYANESLKNYEGYKKDYEQTITEKKEELKETREKITAIENGEKPVSMDKVDILVNSWLLK